tara:strand:- start:880 stop:1176 length:297 start_codon:yes stop_codon:yes gene_type:complete
VDNYYKIFFTIYFDYATSKNKIVTKFFKSDFDLGPSGFEEKFNDENIFRIWNKHANQTSLKILNPTTSFDDSKATNRKIITHRIVNLKTLSEVFLKKT